MIYGNRDSDKMLRGCLFTLGVVLAVGLAVLILRVSRVI